jgi:virginiamycin B lyase
VRRAIIVLMLLALARGPAVAQAVREIPIPGVLFPTGVAVGANGTVFIADRHGDQLVQFDADTGRFTRLALEANSLVCAVAVDGRGSVWLAASGTGTVDRLTPGARRPSQFAPPSLAVRRSAPRDLALSPAKDVLWFSLDSGALGRVPVSAEPPRRGFVVEEFRVASPADRPEGIAVAAGDVAWVALAGSDQLARIDADRTVRRVELPHGSGPRGVAIGRDGAVWVSLFASHRLLRLDPTSLAFRTWELPSGNRAAPWALAVDAAGAVWVAEYAADAIVRFDPARERFVSFAVPTPRARVQALAVDPRGRVWYVGALSQRLGMIE